ncbi:hypothetical protein [Kordiimonas sp.]|uniref:hypothetical protein n=1 Tax=Kordiimonas sp. TaxID=1970157 RepID=UPI003A939067
MNYSMQQTFCMKYMRSVTRWEFPNDPFVTYEPSDEEWCRPLGLGRQVESVETMTFPNAHIKNASFDGMAYTINVVASPEFLDVEAE